VLLYMWSSTEGNTFSSV